MQLYASLISGGSQLSDGASDRGQDPTAMAVNQGTALAVPVRCQALDSLTESRKNTPGHKSIKIDFRHKVLPAPTDKRQRKKCIFLVMNEVAGNDPNWRSCCHRSFCYLECVLGVHECVCGRVCAASYLQQTARQGSEAWKEDRLSKSVAESGSQFHCRCTKQN